MSAGEKWVRATLLVIGLCAAWLPAAAWAQANYRTVVVFGDTQTAVNGGSDGYADFVEQIDWVIANKHTENIDFVLHVGDIIDTGTFLPLPSECEGAPPPGFSCASLGNPCPSPPLGCFSAADGAGGSICLSCSAIRGSVDNQWSSFNSQWSRLEPDLASGWQGLPYAIVRGNHDNIGVPVPNFIDTVGYNQYYSTQHMQDLEAAFAGLDRTFEHHAVYSSSTEGNGHAWKFALGGRPVLVVGPSYEGGQNISTAQINWASGVFQANPDTAGILLVHDAAEYSQINSSIVQNMSTAAPGLIWSAQGHIRRDTKTIDTIQGYQVIKTVSDWSRTASPGGSYFAVMRFYFEPGEDDEVEGFSYSPVIDEVSTVSTSTIAKQPFPVPVPEPASWSMRLAGLAGLVFFKARKRTPR